MSLDWNCHAKVQYTTLNVVISRTDFDVGTANIRMQHLWNVFLLLSYSNVSSYGEIMISYPPADIIKVWHPWEARIRLRQKTSSQTENESLTLWRQFQDFPKKKLINIKKKDHEKSNSGWVVKASSSFPWTERQFMYINLSGTRIHQQTIISQYNCRMISYFFLEPEPP